MEQPKNNLKIVADKKRARMILPNMLTLIGVCIGLTSIRFALDGRFELAIIAILFAALIVFASPYNSNFEYMNGLKSSKAIFFGIPH